MKSILFLVLFLSTNLLFANTPDCRKKNGDALEINNEEVLDWKFHSDNQYHDRGHIKGTIVKLYANATGHNHIEVSIGTDPKDTVEVIYNEDFGSVPSTMKVGSSIEACGDYITANKKNGFHPPSPDGAIVHWVHKSTNPNHMHGFLIIDGTLTGWDSASQSH